MSTPKSRIQKGKEFENYIVDQIREKGLDPKASRSIGSGSGTREKSDIDTNLIILGRNIGIEAKNQKTPHIKKWWKQTQELEKLGREPVLVYSLAQEGFGDAKAVIYLDSLLNLLKKAREPQTLARELNRDDKYKIQRLKQDCLNVLKIINKYDTH